MEGSGNTMLKEVSGTEKDEVTGVWRNLRDEELHIIYTLHSIGYWLLFG